MNESLRKMTTKALIARMREVSHEIYAWKHSLFEGIEFYGTNNSKVSQQIAEDEAELVAMNAEYERRQHDQENTYR